MTWCARSQRWGCSVQSKWLWVAIVVGLVLRLLTLNNALSFDEFVQTKAVLEANPAGLDKYTEMNPLTTWTRLAVTSILGVHVWSLRLTSLLFALLTLWVTFLLARELYGTKAARWATALLALSAWHALVSTSISFDGAFLTFYTVLAMYCFVRYDRSDEHRWLVWCGLASGLAMLTKYTGVLVVFALALYSLIRHKDWKRTAREGALVTALCLAVFSVFPLVAFLTDPSYFWITLQHGQGYFGGRTISLSLLAIQYGLALLWMGPLLLFGYFLSWKKRESRDWLSHSLIIAILAFYTFVVQDPFRPVERYFTILLPALCMLAGKYYASLDFERKHWLWAGAAAVVGMTTSFIVNAMPGKILPFYPKTQFITAMFARDWNFFVPFTGDQGPVGLYVKFLIFALAFGTSAACVVLAVQRKKWAAPVLLGIGLALSVFMMTELALHPTSPDVSRAFKETTSIAKQYPGPYFTFRDPALQYYLGQQATNIDFTSDPEKVGQQLIGTIAMVDFPALDKQGKLWQVFNRCEPKSIVEDKGVRLGYVFVCGYVQNLKNQAATSEDG